jgi:hypothetical protein
MFIHLYNFSSISVFTLLYNIQCSMVMSTLVVAAAAVEAAAAGEEWIIDTDLTN